MNRVKVKICGITSLEDAEYSLECGADMLGFIFYDKSPRYIKPAAAGAIIGELKRTFGFLAVGVFVNPSSKFVNDAINNSGIDMLQFHGEEEDAFIGSFHKKTIKAFRIKEKSDAGKCGEYHTDFFLFDAYSKDAHGGTGKSFDWGILDDFELRERLFLSGGLNSGNIREAVRIVRPYAVDLSSGLEKSPGIKDHAGIKDFFRKLFAEENL